jgi:hypothetical protein
MAATVVAGRGCVNPSALLPCCAASGLPARATSARCGRRWLPMKRLAVASRRSRSCACGLQLRWRRVHGPRLRAAPTTRGWPSRAGEGRWWRRRRGRRWGWGCSRLRRCALVRGPRLRLRCCCTAHWSSPSAPPPSSRRRRCVSPWPGRWRHWGGCGCGAAARARARARVVGSTTTACPCATAAAAAAAARTHHHRHHHRQGGTAGPAALIKGRASRGGGQQRAPAHMLEVWTRRRRRRRRGRCKKLWSCCVLRPSCTGRPPWGWIRPPQVSSHLGHGPFWLRFTYATPVLIAELRRRRRRRRRGAARAGRPGGQPVAAAAAAARWEPRRRRRGAGR